jgi:hypothetical protein
MPDRFSRRRALFNLALAAGACGFSSATLGSAAAAKPGASPSASKAPAAQAKPHVDPKETMAVTLAYHENSATVDAKNFPTYKAGQSCASCLQATGTATDEWRGCNLFPNKLVATRGWCKVYVKKP